MKILSKIITCLMILQSMNADAQLANLKFDIDLELDHMVVSNVRDLDGTEDLFGKIYCMKATALTKFKENKSTMIFFSKTSASANFDNFRNGTRAIDKRIPLFFNMTLNELRNVVLNVGGTIYDHELTFSPFFTCQDCQIAL